MTNFEWPSFNSYNFSNADPMSKILWFLKSLKKYLSNDVFKSKFRQGHNLSFFGLGPWAIIHGITKLVNTFISQIWSLMTSFERSFYKLSENHKLFDIGSTEFKLWQLKESPNHTTAITSELWKSGSPLRWLGLGLWVRSQWVMYGLSNIATKN